MVKNQKLSERSLKFIMEEFERAPTLKQVQEEDGKQLMSKEIISLLFDAQKEYQKYFHKNNLSFVLRMLEGENSLSKQKNSSSGSGPRSQLTRVLY